VSQLYRLLLLVAVTLGLFGQGLAFAAAPMETGSGFVASASDEPASMRTGCADMSAMEDDGAAPCKGLTADCIEKMGCIAPFTLKEPLAQTAPGVFPAMGATWPLLDELAGLDVSPELDPPTLLS
jgi:hypothetical protein